MSLQYYRNIKNGKIYKTLSSNIINCTNKDDGQIMVLYTCKGNESMLFVRELEEFLVKFEPITTQK